MFETLLDPFMNPLLKLSPFWAVFLIAALISLAITLVYKYATDQEHMRKLKEKMKGYQEKMRNLRDQPEKMMKVQQEAMKLNMELMKHSFKPTLYTMIPIILIFGWLNAHMAYSNLAPNTPFTINATFAPGVATATLTVIPELSILSNATQPVRDGKASWVLQGDPGFYKATITTPSGSVEKTFLISKEWRYERPEERYRDKPVVRVVVSNKVIKPLGKLSLFGWHPGWLGTYILLSIILSILFRKALKVV